MDGGDVHLNKDEKKEGEDDEDENDDDDDMYIGSWMDTSKVLNAKIAPVNKKKME